MIQDPLPTIRPMPAPAEVHRALADVFAEPALARAMQPRGNGLLDALAAMWAQVRTWFRELSDMLWDLRSSSPGSFWLLFVVLITVALALLVHIGWTVAQAVRTPPEGAAVSAGEVDARAQSRALRARAHALAAANELRDGVRHLLLALLALVEERRLLAVASSWTIREVLSRLRAAAPTAAWDDLAQRVEIACYSDGSVTAFDFAEVDRWLDALLTVEKATQAA